jgi:hypothetical protein
MTVCNVKPPLAGGNPQKNLKAKVNSTYLKTASAHGPPWSQSDASLFLKINKKKKYIN